METAQKDDPAASADAADSVLGFVNTRSDGKGVERFGNPDDFLRWAQERSLISGETVSKSEAAAARELRSALLTMFAAHSDGLKVSGEELRGAERHLEHVASLYPVRVTLSAAGASASGQSGGAAGVFGSVLARANEVVQSGDWDRMKVCSSDPCRHSFIDRTKNGAQRYCDSRCASRAAMRAMRARQRGQVELKTEE